MSATAATVLRGLDEIADKLPFQTFPTRLYDVHDLYNAENRDELIFDHYHRQRRLVVDTSNEEEGENELLDVARTMHDSLMLKHLRDMLAPHRGRLVGVMGGSNLTRDQPLYLSVARVAYRLVRAEFIVTTGGGPGAMEAANLGAYFALRSYHFEGDTAKHELDLLHAVEMLRRVPSYRNAIAEWVKSAMEVREKYPPAPPPPSPRAVSSQLGCVSIPTWVYGNEPSNVFSSYIAKFFSNSIRENEIVTLPSNGILIFPGSMGTIQETFQFACSNHYALIANRLAYAPMIFIDSDFWGKEKPVFPLLKQILAKGQRYEEWVRVMDLHPPASKNDDSSSPLNQRKRARVVSLKEDGGHSEPLEELRDYLTPEASSALDRVVEIFQQFHTLMLHHDIINC